MTATMAAINPPSDQPKMVTMLCSSRADQPPHIGYISAGPLTRRYTRCANSRCRCHAGHPHGPYWQWSAKVNGKTVTKRLTET